MGQDNPYAKYATHPANPYAGYIPVGDPDPTYRNKGPQSDAELEARRLGNAKIVSDLKRAPLDDAIKRQQLYDAQHPRSPAPAGYRYSADGSRLEVIPGGPKGPKDDAPTREQQRDGMVDVLDQINRAQRLIRGGWATGITGSIAGRVPGTNRRDLEGALSTIGSLVRRAHDPEHNREHRVRCPSPAPHPC